MQGGFFYVYRMKNILLDLGGVVFQSTGISNERIHWDIITQLNHRYGHQLNIGEDLFATFMRDYNALTAQQLSGQEFLEAVFDTLAFNHELVDFLQKSYPINILSDNYRENIAYISQRYHFDRYFKRQFYSFDFALTKNDPEIFRKVIQALDVPAEDFIFIDDSPRKLDSALAVGLKGIQFRDNAQFFADLEAERFYKKE
jgi:HAD superfamily hydrolase (TIGR01509 family)